MSNFLEWIAWHELSALIGWFSLDALVVAAAIAGAIFLPSPFRRLCIEIAIVAAVIGVTYGKGVHDEHSLCTARAEAAEHRAEDLAKKRDELQARLSDQDNAKAQAELDAAHRNDEESAHAAQTKDCHAITDRDLR